MANLTTEQKAEYLIGLKGAYSYVDFNRVENAVKYLSELLRTFSYPNTVNVKTDWQPSDIQKVSEIQRYIDNIAELKNKYYSNVEGEMPTTSTWLTVDGANYIERLLTNIERILTDMQQVFVRSGVATCGQSRLWQQRFRRPSTWYSLNNELSKYNQAWNTVTVPSESVANGEISDTNVISETINAWNAKINEIDALAGVI